MCIDTCKILTATEEAEKAAERDGVHRRFRRQNGLCAKEGWVGQSGVSLKPLPHKQNVEESVVLLGDGRSRPQNRELPLAPASRWSIY